MAHGEAQTILNVIRQAVRQMTRKGAMIDMKRGIIQTGGAYLVSAYFDGESESAREGIRMPAGLYAAAGDYVVVHSDEEGDAWVNEVMPRSLFPKLAIDPNGGNLLVGAGTAEPSAAPYGWLVYSGGSAGAYVAAPAAGGGGSGDVVTTPSADQRITAQSDTTIPLILRAHATQADDIFAVETSAGLVLHRIAANTSHEIHATTTPLELYAYSGAGAWIDGNMSRNATIGSHTIVQDGDVLTGIAGYGSDGTIYSLGGWAAFMVSGTPGVGAMPSMFSVRVSPSGSITPVERLRIIPSGDIVAPAVPTAGGQFRAIAGNYGVMIRNDGSNTYFLLTASADQYGTWNALRPLYFNNATGLVTLGNAVDVVGTITQNEQSAPSTPAAGKGKWYVSTSGVPRFISDGGTDSDLTAATHEAAADPHTGYQKESEKAATNGYASLDGSTKVPIAQVPTGTSSTTVSLGNHTHTITDPVLRVYTGNATWTKPAGLKHIRVRVVGGGGGGGATDTSVASEAATAGGGGGGGYCEKIYVASALSSTESVVIGAAGSAGASHASTPGNGGTGGDSTFSSSTNLLTASGGVGGDAMNATTGNGTGHGGDGGAASGGDINIPGGDGQHGRVLTGVPSVWGNGGASHMSGMQRADGGVGDTGNAYGGGGSGAVVTANTGTRAGGAGVAGVVIVEEYY